MFCEVLFFVYFQLFHVFGLFYKLHPLSSSSAAIVTAGFFGKAFGSAMSSGNETAATGPRHSRILTMLTGR